MARRLGISSEAIEADVQIKVVKAKRAKLEISQQKVWSELDDIRERIQEMRGE
jgi:biotin operon repressor